MAENLNTQEQADMLKTTDQKPKENSPKPLGQAEENLLKKAGPVDIVDPEKSLKAIAGMDERVEKDNAKDDKSIDQNEQHTESKNEQNVRPNKRKNKSISGRTRAVLAAGAIAAAASAVGANSAEAAGAFSSMNFDTGKQYEETINSQGLPESYHAVEAGYDKLKIDPLLEKGREQLQKGMNELTGSMGVVAKTTVDAVGGAIIMGVVGKYGDNINERLQGQLHDALKSSGVPEAHLIPLTKYNPDNMDFSHSIDIGEKGKLSFGASPLGEDKVVGIRFKTNW